jgi:hypothetical protein
MRKSGSASIKNIGFVCQFELKKRIEEKWVHSKNFRP